MAGEIQADYVTGRSVYALIRNTAGQIWNTSAQVFEAFDVGNLTGEEYNVDLTEQGASTGYYVGTFPTLISTAGVYFVTAKEKLGGSPAQADPTVASGDIDWDGSQVRGDGDSKVAVFADNSFTAAALASDAVTEIQSGLATASALSTVAGYVDTEVAAIKSKTDQLTFTTSNKVDAKLTSDGLDNLVATTPTGVASTFREKVLQLWARFFGRVTRDSDEIKTYRSDGTTVATTQTYTASGDDEDISAAT